MNFLFARSLQFQAQSEAMRAFALAVGFFA